MKRLFLLLFAFVAVSITVHAGDVTEQEALLKAQQFMKGKTFKQKNLRRAPQRNATKKNAPYYVFNAEGNDGFVIVSGDDRTEAILGYADKGNLDMDSMPPHVKAWLEGYAKQIEQIRKTGYNGPRKTPANHPAIQPLLTTTWGQDYPYNMNCPDYFDSGYKCVTGCVATAMAQVMYYHRAKSTNTTKETIPSYNCECYAVVYNRQITVDAIPMGTNINWCDMLDHYDGSETYIQKEAVANLMLYCGTAVKMDYKSSASGAYSFDVPVALKRYFDYSEHTTLVWRQDYSNDSWDELIYSELSKGNPVYYSGSNESSGHAFVCDGYDGNGYYHINWGWDGLSDSYFLLSALNPPSQGTGGSSSGYNDGQCALIGAVPNGEIMRLTSQTVSLTGSTSFSLSEVGDNITLPIRWNIMNQTGTLYSFDHAIGLYKNGEFIKVLKETGSSVSFAVDEEVIVDASINIETNLAAGVYQLYALSRTHGDDKWFKNDNSSDCFITLVVKDGSMTFCVGKPVPAENVINFADDEVKRICVENWDTDGDGEISYEEAASVTDFGNVFDRSTIKTFDEAQYFTGITSFSLASYEGYGCKSLVSIKLPSSVTTIKDGAFFCCYVLSSIDIPASVKEIGRGAFYNCLSLQNAVLHEGLEKINDEAFYKCPISSINIPASVSSLSGIIWYGCESLNDFYVDENSSHYCSIDGAIFSKDRKKLIYYPCKRVGSYAIPDGTEIISSNAFTSSKLETVVIPSSVTCIESFGLNSMSNLHEVTIPATITTIETGALYGCVSLEKVVWEGSRSIIPDGMFMHCWSLKNFELPDGLTSIGPNAFRCCSSLKEITIPSTVVSIDDYAFADSGLRKVKSLMNAPCAINSTVFENINSNAVLYVPEESLTSYKEANNWKDFSKIVSIGEMVNEPYAELKNGVLSFFYDTNREEREGDTYDNIEWHEKNSTITKVIFDPSFADFKPASTVQWFDGCDKLTEIQGIENLNTSEVTDMGSMFNGCSGLTSLDLSTFNTSEVTNMTTMFSGCSSLTSINLSGFNTNKITSMFAMFWNCRNLKTVVLPNDLKFIDSYQFVYCSSLEEISIPSTVTSIGDQAFAGGCYSLKAITIPTNVTYIGDNAFSNSGLTKVISLMESPCNITSTVFENVSSNATLLVPAGSKAAYEAADYWKDFKEIVEIGDINGDGVVDVSDYIGVANHILGNTPAGFDTYAADVNNDGVIDVSDYIGIANIILTGSIYGNNNNAAPAFEEDEELDPQ